jgi:hypothetical protein
MHMTESDQTNNAIQKLLDAVVYLPVGTGIALSREIPKLENIGREHVNSLTTNARVIGQFAVQIGSGEIKKLIPKAIKTAEGLISSVDIPGTLIKGTARARSNESVHDHTSRVYRPDIVTDTPSTNGKIVADNGAVNKVIPGYDNLAASQVVRRLNNLSKNALSDIRSYETMTKHRQTIISKVDQLLNK